MEETLRKSVETLRLSKKKNIREIRVGFSGVRVIVITLHDSQGLKAASAAAGAAWFIPKPSVPDKLPDAIARLFPDHASGAQEERR